MLEHPYINLATQHTIEDLFKSTGPAGPLGDPVIAATQFHKRESFHISLAQEEIQTQHLKYSF